MRDPASKVCQRRCAASPHARTDVHLSHGAWEAMAHRLYTSTAEWTAEDGRRFREGKEVEMARE